MRRIAVVPIALALSGSLLAVLPGTPASAETRSWSTPAGVVKDVKVAFGQDRVRLSMSARAPQNGGFNVGHWRLKTTGGSHPADFELVWSQGLEPSFSHADGSAVDCPGIRRAVGSTSVRFSIPVSCLADAEGAEPGWIRSQLDVGVEGTGPHGDFVRRHGTFPRGGGFTAPVSRGADAG
jgi:hypothetical protein